METFRKKQPADYADPYQDMLADINNKIAYFKARNTLLPNYIIINTTDYDLLIAAAKRAKLIPGNASDLPVIQSARIMATNQMAPGHFDVVGN